MVDACDSHAAFDAGTHRKTPGEVAGSAHILNWRGLSQVLRDRRPAKSVEVLVSTVIAHRRRGTPSDRRELQS